MYVLWPYSMEMKILYSGDYSSPLPLFIFAAFALGYVGQYQTEYIMKNVIINDNKCKGNFLYIVIVRYIWANLKQDKAIKK